MTDQEPPPLPDDRPRAGTVRSRLMLEVASELVGRADWPDRQARIDLRPQGPGAFPLRLFASDGPDAVVEVLDGTTTFAILNPATALRSAERRAGGDDDLAVVTTVPSYDQMGFAVRADLGLGRLDDLAEVRPALRVSLRAQRNHAVHLVVDDVLAAVGTSLDDLVAWGGSVQYVEGIPHRGDRAATMAAGEFDAVFDEGIYNWTPHATEAGLRFLDLGDEALERLAAQGYRRSWLRRERFPDLPADVATVDFSGFVVYTRRDTDPGLVRAFCEALEARRGSIPWQGGPELPLERMCVDALDAPTPLPLHPAAETFWRERGLLAGDRDREVGP